MFKCVFLGHSPLKFLFFFGKGFNSFTFSEAIFSGICSIMQGIFTVHVAIIWFL